MVFIIDGLKSVDVFLSLLGLFVVIFCRIFFIILLDFVLGSLGVNLKLKNKLCIIILKEIFIEDIKFMFKYVC